MKLGVLFSGGKDSCLAMQKVLDEGHDVSCLISIYSQNKESYMFHTPNIELSSLQAQAMNMPLLRQETLGVKEEELVDLESALGCAIGQYGVEGVVTGGVKSSYQKSRFEGVCEKLGLECINPLWGVDEVKILRSVLDYGFEVVISGVFAEPLDESWVGLKLDENLVERLIGLREDYGISPAGEGGELETTVLDGPFFREKIVVSDSRVVSGRHTARYVILDAGLQEK